MGLDQLPIIRDLDKFAEELPPNLRARLYETAVAFLGVGRMNGTFITLGVAESPVDHQILTDYLSEKVKEYTTPRL